MRKSVRLFIATCFLIASSAAAQTQNSNTGSNSAILVDGVDVSPLVQAIGKGIVTLKKPVFVFHWFQGNSGSIWTQPLPSNSPHGFHYLTNSSQVYLNDYGNDTTGNMYGRGLYAALDPVVTRSYGGYNWVLAQIQFPKGLRILDLTGGNGYSPFSAQIIEVLKSLKCNSISNVDSILQGATKESPECRKNLKQVLKSKLNFQAFAYGYSSSYFDECREIFNSTSYPSPRRSTAFVIVDSSWFRPELVKVFNSQTSGEFEARSLILSLFYKADHDGTKPENKDYAYNIRTSVVQKVLKEAYPDYYMTGMEQQCSGGNSRCTTLYRLTKYENGQSTEIKVPEPPIPALAYPQTISKNQIPFSSNLYGQQGTLLWQDLDGKPTVSNLSQWIKGNLYGCSPAQEEVGN